jgi:SAM-dependent methyltransferase
LLSGGSGEERTPVSVKDLVPPIPGVLRQLPLLRRNHRFTGTTRYWERRYVGGGTSGAGSYGEFGAAKAEYLNAFVTDHDVRSVVEFGCGDGHVLSLANYPSYVGLDVSRTAIEMCARRFSADPAKSFFLYDGSCFVDHGGLFTADLALSLDVIYHLIEDSLFETYMSHLFAAGRRYVVVYSTNAEIPDDAPHVRHRCFSSWVQDNYPQWRLAQLTEGPVLAEFFVYERIAVT